VSVALAFALFFGAPPPTNDACFAAAVEGQTLRKQGKLLDARTPFSACATPTCPSVVSDDCTRWLAELEDEIPTVVFGARDRAERDVPDVSITVDSKAVDASGKPVALDPGPHVVRFLSPGRPVTQQTILTRAGEKNRTILVTLADPPPQEKHDETSIPTATWILGGVGLAALGVFGLFAASGVSLYGSANCSAGCSASDKSDVETRLRIADVSLGVGVVALGAAAVIYFLPRR
jgi:hypothetical protein